MQVDAGVGTKPAGSISTKTLKVRQQPVAWVLCLLVRALNALLIWLRLCPLPPLAFGACAYLEHELAQGRPPLSNDKEPVWLAGRHNLLRGAHQRSNRDNWCQTHVSSLKPVGLAGAVRGCCVPYRTAALCCDPLHLTLAKTAAPSVSLYLVVRSTNSQVKVLSRQR